MDYRAFAISAHGRQSDLLVKSYGCPYVIARQVGLRS
jgi:hypothetical protein